MFEGAYKERDYEHEEKLARLLEEKWACTMHRQHSLAQFDFIAHRNGVPVSFVEIRKRRKEMMTYPTVIISMTKLIAAKYQTDITGLPCFFVVEWSDKTAYVDLECHKTFSLSGNNWKRRHNEYGPQTNIELLGNIDINQFKVLKFN